MMKSDEVSDDIGTDWQVKRITFAEKAKHLLDSGLYSDCEFLVGNEDGKKIFRAHKLILVMSSPIFEVMFFGKMAQNVIQDAVEVTDLQPGTFNKFLQYIYTQQLEFNSFDQAVELYYAGKKYMFPKLCALSFEYISDNMKPENACKALELALLCDDAGLREKSLDVIRRNIQELLSSRALDEISEIALVRIVVEDNLNITSELELFRAVYQWAFKECSRREIETSCSNVRLVLKSVVPHIRFLAMTNEEFAGDPVASGILNHSEMLAISMNINTSDAWQMPDYLSSSREARFANKQNTQPNAIQVMPSTYKKIYCLRDKMGIEEIKFNSDFLDCQVTLMASQNVCLRGIVVPSQTEDKSSSPYDHLVYTEQLYCELFDKKRTRLASLHFSGQSQRNSTLDLCFNEPVKILANNEYRIHVIFGRAGCYPLVCASKIKKSRGVQFRFGTYDIKLKKDLFVTDFNDGLLRGVILSS